MTTSPLPPQPNRWRSVFVLGAVLFAFSLLALGSLMARDDYYLRGIEPDLPGPIPQGGTRIGVNVALQKYSSGELAEVLSEIQHHRIDYIKQTFHFSEDFDWSAAGVLVDAIADQGLILVPLLDGNPSDSFAPPDVSAYAAWAGEFAARFGNVISHYIVWDEPNLASHWGGEPVNPNEYAALLSAAAAEIRRNDPDAIIVAAPLAPTTETGPDNLSETLFLEALYEAGASNAFDVVGAKPYGFDTGPEDRTVRSDRLNFSRPILLRELMIAQGDAHKAIWAGNWGWNSLPPGWSGSPSIWGQTDETNRSRWTVEALERSRREWPWMGVLFLENWEPDSSVDDPVWGFSIAGRPTAEAIADYIAAQPVNVANPGFHPARPDDPAQVYEGSWEFSPDFGADIGETGDRVKITFWGTGIGLRVRRADFRARLYATVDGQPANMLPSDENGTMLVLTSADPSDDYLTTEWIARGLTPGPHVLEIVAARGWDQWALNGFSVAYRPASVSQPWQRTALGVTAVLGLALAIFATRRADWGATGRSAAGTFHRLSGRAQLALTGGAAALVALTGWLTWGQDALGIYRRLGDAGQLAATAAAASVFYVTPSFVIYAIALVVLFFLLVLRPAWGLVLIALTIPFYVPPLPKPILGYRFSPVEVFTLVTAAAWLTRITLDRGLKGKALLRSATRPRLARADWAVLIFALVATLSLAFTERRDVALTEWRVVIIEPVIWYALLRLMRLQDSEWWVILDAFVLGGTIVALYGLWQYAIGENLITAEGGLLRLRSIYGSPNNVALYLDRLLPFLAAMLLLGSRSSHGRRWYMYVIAAVPIGAALILTFSKGALLLGIPASLLVVFWVWQRRAGRRTWPWIIVAIFGGIAALVLAARIPALAARLDLFGTTGFFRISLWRAAVNMAYDHPWLGVGLDNFLYAYRGRYIFDAAWQEPNLNHPHNILLDFATRLGLIGLLVGAWMVGEAVAAAYRGIKQAGKIWLPVAAGVAGALAAMLAHGLVDHSLFLVDLSFVFFLLLGLAVHLSQPALKMPDEIGSS